MTTKPPFISLRLGEHHRKPALLNELLDIHARHPGAFDEVWFASIYGFPSIAEHRRSAEAMACAAEAVRAAGIVASLQISNTLGHGGPRHFEATDGIAWQRMVGPDGVVSPRCNCPRDPAFHDYLDTTTRAYCAWRPSAVWINDDLRMRGHNPVMWGCFCPLCLAAFAVQEGCPRTRDELLRAFDAPDGGGLRLRWAEFGAESLAIVARVAGGAAIAQAPEATLGVQHMQVETQAYSSGFLPRVCQALSEVSGRPAAVRPGVGCYTDHRPRELLVKGQRIARDIVHLPPEVTLIRPEVENWPHVAMGKSVHGTLVESAHDLALGCTGLSYATLEIEQDPLSWHEDMLARFATWRPYLERLVRINTGTRPGGLEAAMGNRHAARAMPSDAAPFEWAQLELAPLYHLPTLGLPLAMDRDFACGTVLHAAAAAGMTDDELRERFAGGVLTDGETILLLEQRNLRGLTGLSARPLTPMDAVEVFTDDPLNGVEAGRAWFQYGFAAALPVHTIEADGAARVLGRYATFAGADRGVATLLTETPAGGRVAVFGFNAWESVVSGPRRNQLLAAADWVSRGRLPVLIETVAPVVPVPRVTRDGRLRSLTLLNASIDRTPPLRVRVRNAGTGTVLWLAPEQRGRSVPATPDGDDRILTLPPIPAWSIGTLQFAERQRSGR